MPKAVSDKIFLVTKYTRMTNNIQLKNTCFYRGSFRVDKTVLAAHDCQSKLGSGIVSNQMATTNHP